MPTASVAPSSAVDQRGPAESRTMAIAGFRAGILADALTALGAVITFTLWLERTIFNLAGWVAIVIMAPYPQP